MTGGRVVVVVVVGGSVVGVLVDPAAGVLGACGLVGAVVESEPDEAPGTVVGPAGGGPDGGVVLAEAPGCSRATVTPMKAAAPVLTRTASWVNQRIRACVRARALGVREDRPLLAAWGWRASTGSRVGGRGMARANCTRPT